jgi:hypothetical protein
VCVPYVALRRMARDKIRKKFVGLSTETTFRQRVYIPKL